MKDDIAQLYPQALVEPKPLAGGEPPRSNLPILFEQIPFDLVYIDEQDGGEDA